MALFAAGRIVALMVVAATAVVVSADFAADRAECADQLMGLATCLTFVEATATVRAPTPDCCAGFKQVLGASKKCLCVLVRDRDEPALGFKINVTRAMDLPSACSIQHATFSDCPKILNISSNSKEAEIFNEYARKHESKNGAAPAVPAAATGTTGGKSANAAPAAGAAGAGRLLRRTLSVGIVSALLVSVFVLA